MTGDRPLSEDKQSDCAIANAGSPALPVYEKWVELGLSKRELLAAMAMQGLLGISEAEPREMAKHAVDYADALLKELAK